MRVRLMIDVETGDWQNVSNLVTESPPVRMAFQTKSSELVMWGRLIGAEEAYETLIEELGSDVGS